MRGAVLLLGAFLWVAPVRAQTPTAGPAPAVDLSEGGLTVVFADGVTEDRAQRLLAQAGLRRSAFTSTRHCRLEVPSSQNCAGRRTRPRR